MRQQSLLSTTPPPAPATDDSCDRDLFGNPIRPSGPAAPAYRPRKPVQQALDLAPSTFTLDNK